MAHGPCSLDLLWLPGELAVLVIWPILRLQAVLRHLLMNVVVNA
ncbi:hypothetical protein A2U01_0117901, partial [Trifolium medium]|nr:hypothetical protein [Trifolium medium]